MKKLIITVAAAAILGAAVPASAAGIPVFDATRAADFIQQFARMQEQLQTAQDQLASAQELFASISGNRGFGGLMRNPDLRAYLPADMQAIYDSVTGGGYPGISGSIQDILGAEDFAGAVDAMQRHIEQRNRVMAATNKAVGLRGYEGAQARLNQIEDMTDQIAATQDGKAIAELQARIAAEQAAIQNETTKLQMISQLQQAEARLADEQKAEMSRRILNPSNTGMPRVRF